MTIHEPIADDVERQTSDPDRTFPVRRVDFAQAIEDLDADFATDGDVVLQHLLANLSGLFPDGEQLFIDSVKHYRDRITDPDLKRQVNAFIGQEVTHGREHRDLNARLGELGYRSAMVEEMLANDDPLTPGMRRIIWLFSRVGPLKGVDLMIDEEPDPEMALAITAALEHYTATMAEQLLTSPELQASFADDGLFRMWAWHAIEECEHKAVAFDVFKAIGGSEETRVRAMKLATLSLTFITGYHTVAGVLRDRRSWRPGGLLASLRRFRRNPLLTKEFRQRLADYTRPDFHPLDHDTTAIERSWRAWFDDGADRPVPAAAA